MSHVSPIVFVAKFFSSPSALTSLLCSMHPALLIFHQKKNWNDQTAECGSTSLLVYKKVLLWRLRKIGHTYQHIQEYILPLESLCKLPDFACLWHVHNMDVNLLEDQSTLFLTNHGMCPPPFNVIHCLERNNTHRVARLLDDVHSGFFCLIFVSTHHVDGPTCTQNTGLHFEPMLSAQQRS